MPAKKAAAKKPEVDKGMSGGNLQKFSSKDPASIEKFKSALSSGKVGSIHVGGQWESIK